MAERYIPIPGTKPTVVCADHDHDPIQETAKKRPGGYRWRCPDERADHTDWLVEYDLNRSLDRAEKAYDAFFAGLVERVGVEKATRRRSETDALVDAIAHRVFGPRMMAQVEEVRGQRGPK